MFSAPTDRHIFPAGLWGTTLTENISNNREKFVRTTIRELLVYLVFLVDICIRECSTHTLQFVFLLSEM